MDSFIARSLRLPCRSTATLVQPKIACSLPSTSGRPCTILLKDKDNIPRNLLEPTRLPPCAASKRRASSVSTSLIAVLKDEIKYERDAYRRNEMIIGEPPNEFELQDVRGSTMFMLTKELMNQEIIVRVDMDAQPEYDEGEDEDEDEDEDEADLPIAFQVAIRKDGDDTLVFNCESDGEYLTINGIMLENADEDESEPPTYRGPVFKDLDDTLQQAFVDYLEERGVNAYLGEYIRLYLVDKATLEYQQWLGRVRDFIGR